MSKSLGNLVMVSDLLKKYSSNAIRWLLLSHHYRKEWEFDEKDLQDAEMVIQSFGKGSTKGKLEEEVEKLIENDFDFPAALELVKNTPASASHLLRMLGFMV